MPRYGRVGEIAERHNSSLDMSWCGTDDLDAARMRSLRHAVPRSVFEYVASLKGRMPSIHKMGTDMAVPDEHADEMMRFYSERLEAGGLEYVIFGHIGDNHPHVEIILRDMDDFEKAKAMQEQQR
jgi:D-lactate dehydrogenase (cytochrome)